MSVCYERFTGLFLFWLLHMFISCSCSPVISNNLLLLNLVNSYRVVYNNIYIKFIVESSVAIEQKNENIKH